MGSRKQRQADSQRRRTEREQRPRAHGLVNTDPLGQPAGASTIEQGLLIDLRDINHVVLEEDMSCRVGGGCIWDQVYKELQ